MLDLACGDGVYSNRLQDMGFEATAADLDRKHFLFKGKLRFVSLNLLEDLPFKDASFDYVLFLEIIEHLYNPADVMREIVRILKPGGGAYPLYAEHLSPRFSDSVSVPGKL